MKRIIAGGSRNFGDYLLIEETLTRLPVDADTVLVIGDGFGLDDDLNTAATTLGAQVEVFDTDWDFWKNQAAFKRMDRMIESGADLVLVFINDTAPASQYLVKKARQAGIKVTAVRGPIFQNTSTPNTGVPIGVSGAGGPADAWAVAGTE